MLNLRFNPEYTLLLIVKFKRQFFIGIAVVVSLIIAYLTFSFYQTKKKALISGEIAVGLAYLEEGKKEVALYYLEKAFNNSNNFYQVVSGIGVIKSISETSSSEIKTLNVLNIIKDGTKNQVIKNLMISTFLSNSSVFDSEAMQVKTIEKFETFATKTDVPYFKEALLNLYLNSKKQDDFQNFIKNIPNTNSFYEESEVKFNVKERALLLKSL